MSEPPKRTNDAVFADVLIRQNKHDLFLFIEDEKMPHVYKKIISKLFDDSISIGRIYSLKSKENVLEKFERWKDAKSVIPKCFFIVDKDFNHIKGDLVDEHSNLIELEYYTIENYFISKKGALSLLESKVFNKSEEELIELLDWENWESNTYPIFKELFLAYAIAFKYDLKENCGLSPHIYLNKGSAEIDSKKVEEYINGIKKICIEKGNINYDLEYEKINAIFDKQEGYEYNKLIKGKYLYATLLKSINYKTSKKIDEDLGSLVIVDNLELEGFEFIKKKIEKIL